MYLVDALTSTVSVSLSTTRNWSGDTLVKLRLTVSSVTYDEYCRLCVDI